MFKEYIVNENQKPALSIIFDKNKLGDVIASEIVDTPEQSGRPLLMVLTKLNYLLLNTHGLQDAAKGQNFHEFNNFNKKQVDFIQNQAEDFYNSHNLNGVLNGVILVGDFNDRFDQIQEFNILKKKMLQTDDAPKSCCYNYDSSCTNNNFTSFFPDDPKDSKKYKYGYCNAKPPTDDKGKPIKGPLNDDEGHTKNYVNAGDKVFSSFETAKMKIFQGIHKDGLSVESDHQLVYAEISLPDSLEVLAGGRKKRTRKNRRKKHRKINKNTKKSKKVINIANKYRK